MGRVEIEDLQQRSSLRRRRQERQDGASQRQEAQLSITRAEQIKLVAEKSSDSEVTEHLQYREIGYLRGQAAVGGGSTTTDTIFFLQSTNTLGSQHSTNLVKFSKRHFAALAGDLPVYVQIKAHYRSEKGYPVTRTELAIVPARFFRTWRDLVAADS
ncbi:hypothetical protein PYCC9005_003253 [Savitreella phatthalungensis]